MITFYCSDPPEVSLDGTTSTAVEYTTRNIACRTSGGNPSDPGSYQYKWMYRPTYIDSDRDLDPPYGMYLTSLVLTHLGLMSMIVGMNTAHDITWVAVRTHPGITQVLKHNVKTYV